MALETVTITVLSDDLVPVTVDDVVVRVFDETGTTLITSGTTGDPIADGVVEFTLDGDVTPIRYQLRIFISGGSISSPKYIDVYSPAVDAPTGANNFELTATLFTLPQAVNPRLCRASGYVLGPDGRPRSGIDVHFIPCFSPLIVDDYGVLGERVACHTDTTGYISVDLFRTGVYRAIVEGHENSGREVVVPDRASINIFHLLFPRVATVDWSITAPWSVATGSSFDVTPELTATDFQVLDGAAAEDVAYTVENTAVATVEVVGTAIKVKGVAPGSTNVVVTRIDSSLVYIPDLDIVGGTVAVTVS